MTVVTGKPGVAYMCPEHGRFVPDELPRYDADRPEVKCKAWLPEGRTYCGRFCSPVADRFTFHEPIYGRMDDRGRFVVTHPRWMKLRAVLGALVPYVGPIVTAIDRDRGVITIGRRG